MWSVLFNEHWPQGWDFNMQRQRWRPWPWEKGGAWGSGNPELSLLAAELEVASPSGVAFVPMPAEVVVPLG
jgi:hypothetical protein